MWMELMKQKSFAEALKTLIKDYDGLTIEAKIIAVEHALRDLELAQMEAERHAEDKRYGAQLMMEGLA